MEACKLIEYHNSDNDTELIWIDELKLIVIELKKIRDGN